jgi:hypothetical protein
MGSADLELWRQRSPARGGGIFSRWGGMGTRLLVPKGGVATTEIVA